MSMLSRRVLIGGCLVTLLGCGASLLQEISQAQYAIKTAQEAKADQYASDLLLSAKSSLDEAMLLRNNQRQDARELLLRAQLQAEVAAELAKERAVAEQLQAVRDQRDAAKAAAEKAEQAAQAAKAEVGKPVLTP
ncbi:MAG: DUF4398 domain-containing protein [Nitrospirae bacterium]|nr:DUF4398 domain-containing protein [Nitrospirota bacterium]